MKCKRVSESVELEKSSDLAEIETAMGDSEQSNDDEELSGGSDEEGSEEDAVGHELDKEETGFRNKTISTEELEKFRAKIENTGVAYISRIPPRMAAGKLRRLLSRYKVKIGRIYLAPEDKQIRKKRQISGGSRQKMYTEGWIEFMDKSKGKSLVRRLNNTNMDPKKTSYHHEDLWNLKYLPKFKWSHLTERMAYEKQARNQKLQAEIAQSKKINQQYISKVEQAKMIDGIESKKRARSTTSNEAEPSSKVVRHFHQKKTIFSDAKQATSQSKGSTAPKNKKLDSVLDKIFG